MKTNWRECGTHVWMQALTFVTKGLYIVVVGRGGRELVQQTIPSSIKGVTYVSNMRLIWVHHKYSTLTRSSAKHVSCVIIFWDKPYPITNTLQRLQAFFILSQTVVLGLATFQLQPFQNTPSIFTINLLQAIDFWHRESPCIATNWFLTYNLS